MYINMYINLYCIKEFTVHECFRTIMPRLMIRLGLSFNLQMTILSSMRE